jgi:hypothetical protein
MPNLQITRRPIVLETQASGAMLTDILGRMEAISGRSALYGVSDPVKAKLLAGESIEADFTRGDYRDGFVRNGALATLPGWAFARTGAGYAYEADGGLSNFLTGVPRITDQGLLVEPQRTNLITHSKLVSGWSNNGSATVTANSLLGPDGTMTGTTVASGSAVADSGRYHLATVTAGQTYAESYIVKNVSGCTAMRVGPTNAAVFVNPTTGTIISAQAGALSPTIERLPNDWFLVQFTRVAPSTTMDDAIYTDQACSFGVFHAQLELGASPTAPIFTTGSTATRGADAPTVEWDNLFPVTLVAEFDFTGVAGRIAVFDDSGSTPYANMIMLHTGPATVLLDVTDQMVSTLASLSHGGLAAGERVRAALCLDNDSARLCVNGGAVQTALLPGLPQNINRLRLGHYVDGTALNGPVRSFMASRVRLSDAEMQAATA